MAHFFLFYCCKRQHFRIWAFQKTINGFFKIIWPIPCSKHSHYYCDKRVPTFCISMQICEYMLQSKHLAYICVETSQAKTKKKSSNIWGLVISSANYRWVTRAVDCFLEKNWRNKLFYTVVWYYYIKKKKYNEKKIWKMYKL